MYGNFLMIRGFMNDAKEQLEKAIELDEQGCFGAHYTVANMLENSIPDMAMMGQLSPLQRLQVKSFTQQGQKHLEKYVQLAPKGHWHRHRACILLMFCKARLTARGSEKLDAIERRVPGFCAGQIALFETATESLKLYVNCFGLEQGDFKGMYENASQMIAAMYELGLTGGAHSTSTSEYICANPSCTKAHSSETPLSRCTRCLSVRYCGKACQTKHWKSGHKKDCKRLAREYEEQRKIQTLPRHDVSQPMIGDSSVELDVSKLFK